MHDPSFMAPALIISEKMTSTQKVYAAAADAAAGKIIHMSRFCFAGETKTEISCFYVTTYKWII